MRACFRAAHSSMRSLGIPSATAFAMPPISSISSMNYKEKTEIIDKLHRKKSSRRIHDTAGGIARAHEWLQTKCRKHEEKRNTTSDLIIGGSIRSCFV